MSPWLLVWFVVTSVTTVVVIVFVAALARHVQVLGRTAKRLGEEAGPVVDEISRLGARASDRASRLQTPGRSGREQDSG